MSKELEEFKAKLLKAAEEFRTYGTGNCKGCAYMQKVFDASFGPLLAECEPPRARFSIDEVVHVGGEGYRQIATVDRDTMWSGGFRYRMVGSDTYYYGQTMLRKLTPAEIGPREQERT